MNTDPSDPRICCRNCGQPFDDCRCDIFVPDENPSVTPITVPAPTRRRELVPV